MGRFWSRSRGVVEVVETGRGVIQPKLICVTMHECMNNIDDGGSSFSPAKDVMVTISFHTKIGSSNSGNRRFEVPVIDNKKAFPRVLGKAPAA